MSISVLTIIAPILEQLAGLLAVHDRPEKRFFIPNAVMQLGVAIPAQRDSFVVAGLVLPAPGFAAQYVMRLAWRWS
jgi:hypothetical protein